MFAMFLPVPGIQELAVGYDQFSGLSVKLNGVSFIRGSSFQYVDPQSGKSLYSSRWAPKRVTPMPDGTLRVQYTGDNGNAVGTLDFTPKINGLTARYQFKWRGSGFARVENNLALVWAPAVSHGEATCDGQTIFELFKPTKGSWADRKLAGPGASFDFEANLAHVSVDVRGAKLTMFDGRGFSQDWAKGSCLFWLGQSGLRVAQGETLEVVAEWKFGAEPQRAPAPQEVRLKPYPVPVAVKAKTDSGPIVPKPKSVETNSSRCLLAPAPHEELNPPEPLLEFNRVLKTLWDTEDVTVELATSVSPIGLKRDGYEFKVTPFRIDVRAADQQALLHALSTLARMAKPDKGNLYIPCGTVSDWPSVTWRGVHFFSGKNSLDFQKLLIDNLFAPLGFDHAVIECERTQWDAVPDDIKSKWATKADVAQLFDAARSKGIEPVPLIQSQGHMDWLLNGSKNELAFNPSQPYTLDSRKQAARELIDSIWLDAIRALKPKMIHFGLDETDKRGMLDDPTIATRLWKAQVPELVRLARKSGVAIGAWSDMMLAPGQAVDAAHAPNPAQASERRAALPQGSTIFDWHYFETDDSSKYSSLKLWRDWGMKPIATSWHKPRNIRAQTLAAIEAGAGTLQATWAGYENDQASYEANPDQLGAYVLAADYAWSGRTDKPTELGYDPIRTARLLLWPEPGQLRSRAGTVWLPDGHPQSPLWIGPIQFDTMPFASLNTPLTGPGSFGASELRFGISGSMREVDLAMDTIGWEADGQAVASLNVDFADGGSKKLEIRYGAHVRAPEDERPTLLCDRANGLSLVRIDFGSIRTVRQMTLSPVSVTAGARVRGITTW